MIPLQEFEKEMVNKRKSKRFPLMLLAAFLVGFAVGWWAVTIALSALDNDSSGKADRGKTRQYVEHYVVGQKVN